MWLEEAKSVSPREPEQFLIFDSRTDRGIPGALHDINFLLSLLQHCAPVSVARRREGKKSRFQRTIPVSH
jgi:hypothetical protein